MEQNLYRTGGGQRNFRTFLFPCKRGKKNLSLVNVGDSTTIQSITWTSSAPSIAAIDSQTGEVTARKTGSATINAVVVYTTGESRTYSSRMKVSNPKLSATTMVVAIDVDKSLPFKGINDYSSFTITSSKESVATVNANGSIRGKNKGYTTVTVNVDGKEFTCEIYVSNPTLKKTYSLMSVKKTAQISLKGLSSMSKVTYTSSNKKVASVSKTGTIKSKSGGRATITIHADGKEFQYVVEVASKKAISARKKGKKIIDSSTYSQEKRMTEGYYDCSSLVFRAYGCDTKLLGGSKSWAPTAAAMAEYMQKTGKVIAWEEIPVEELRPGDLIFKGGEDNGRYLGIYHVSMYYGDGLCLESPMRDYYSHGNIVMIARPAP